MSDKLSRGIRRAIEESGMSRYRLSRESGVTQAALSRFMHGKRGLTLDSADRLMDVLGLEIRPRRQAKEK